MKREIDEVDGNDEIPMKRALCSAATPPTGFKIGKVYSVYVSLCWNKEEKFDEYVISYHEEGCEWDCNSDKLVHVSKKKGRCILYPLKPETVYEFRMMGKIGKVETVWSEVISVKTEARLVIPDVDNVVRELQDSMGNVNECIEKLSAISNLLLRIDDGKKAFGEVGAIEMIINAMNAYPNNIDICKSGCFELLDITTNDENKVIAGECGVIEAILNTVKAHSDISIICKYGCSALGNITIDVTNRMKGVEKGAIDVILDLMKKNINNDNVFEGECYALGNISDGSSSIQNEICEKGGLTVLLEILKKCDERYKVSIAELCCSVIGTLLSSNEINAKFCTQDALSTVRECYERYPDSEQIRQFFLGLIRKEDAKTKDAVSKGVCTKDAFPKCGNDCRCDESYYCVECCTQQRGFRCYTCDGDGGDDDENLSNLYCETCWKRDHQGHECEEFFYPMRCATKK